MKMYPKNIIICSVVAACSMLALHIGTLSKIDSTLPESFSQTKAFAQSTASDIPETFGEAVPISAKTLWSHAWNSMPQTVSSEMNSAKTLSLDHGLELHVCWCYIVRVKDIGDDFNWNGEESGGVRVWKDEVSGNLTLIEDGKYIALYDREKKITSTIVYDGTRGHRFENWSVYFFSDGRITAVLPGDSNDFYLMNEGEIDVDAFVSDQLPLTWAEVIALDIQFMSRVTSNLIYWGE